MLDDISQDKPFTLLDLVREMNIHLTTNQLSKLGIEVSRFARSRGIKIKKVPQRENNRVCKVNSYPADGRQLIRTKLESMLSEKPRKRRRRIKYAKV